MDNLRFFEKAVKVVDKYGGWRVFQTIVYVGLFLFITFYVPAITRFTVEKATMSSIEQSSKEKEYTHFKNLEKRKSIQPQINTALSLVLNNTYADRAFIMELHNGSNNLNGVPFLHGSVTYEKSLDGLDSIDEEYQNISLSRFDMATYLHTNFGFIGTIDDLLKIDKKLASKLSVDDVKFVVVITLHNGTNEWGWFGIMYNRTDNIPDERDIMKEMTIASQTISNLLNVLNE